MNNKQKLCPFSKPLAGDWCACPYAILVEQRAGKMVCGREDEYLDSCTELSEVFKDKSRFVLGVGDDTELTHAQLMKVRIGGLLGMQRVLTGETELLPAVREIIDGVVSRYGSVAHFPFNEIVRDIRAFSHRKKTRS